MSNKIERLVKMANDISNFFDTESDKTLAAEGVKKHILRAWEPKMRQAIVDYSQKDGAGLSPLATEAIKRLAAH